MNHTQRYLYAQATRPILSRYVDKSEKNTDIVDYKNTFLRPAFKESIVCEAYDMKIPAYSVEVDSGKYKLNDLNNLNTPKGSRGIWSCN